MTLLVLVVLLGLAPSPSAAQVMKLLTPDTGWILRGNTLYWTADGGSQWSDITPVPPGVMRAGVRIQSVFFLDMQQGWAVVSYPEKIVPLTPEAESARKTLYEIVHTVNSGQTWSFMPFAYPELSETEQHALAGPVSMYFLDARHGWLNIAFAGNAKPARILGTDDGGQSWDWVGKPIVAGDLRFTSTQDGWVAGGMDNRLYTTHDGCRTWHEVALTPPGEVGAATQPTYEGPPVFEDPRHGFTAVYYIGGSGVRPMLVVYSTTDGGTTWKPAKIVRGTEEAGATAVIPFTITDSVLAVSTAPSDKHVTAAIVPLVGSLDSGVEFTTRGAPKLSFADASNGWALSIDGRMHTTRDAGVSWKQITPWHVPAAPPAAEPPASKRPSTEGIPRASGSLAPEELAASGQGGGGGGGVGSATHLSARLTFAVTRVMTAPNMPTVW